MALMRGLRHPCGHPLMTGVALASLLVVCSVLQASAENTDAHATRMKPAATPLWTRPASLASFIAAALCWPFQIVTFFMLIRRRKRYPIAGRGWLYLLVANIVSWTCVSLLTLVALYFGHGMPCPVEFCLSIMTLPGVLAYILRGGVFVCRLEVRNFLAERQWRLEKASAIKQMREEATTKEIDEPKQTDSQQNGDGGGGSTPPAKNEVERISIPVASDSNSIDLLNEEVDLTPEHIPGFWFLSHRELTSPKYILTVVFVVSSYIVSAVVAMIFLDPDVAHQRDWREAKGLAPDPEDYGSQFLQGHFLNSPPCLNDSPKNFLVLGFFAAIVPFGIWCVARLWLDSRKQQARKKEQLEFQRRIHKNGTSSASARLLSKHAPSESESFDNLDDTLLVKNEFGLIVMLSITAMVLPLFTNDFGMQWAIFIMLMEHLVYWFVSIVLPLIKSEAISRRHRQAMMQSRGDETSGGKKLGGYGGAALAHQRPYYSLKFILHNAHTYPALLKFLQKEYSSENALFYTEVRELKALCVQLERAMPSWPQGRNNESGSEAGSGGGGSSGAIVPLARATRSRTLLSGTPLVTLPSKRNTFTPAPGALPLLQQLRLPSLAVATTTVTATAVTSSPVGVAPSSPSGLVGDSTALLSPPRFSLNGSLPLPPLVGVAGTGTAGAPAAAASGSPLMQGRDHRYTVQVTPVSPTRALQAAAGTANSMLPPLLQLPPPSPSQVGARFAALHADAQRAKEWCLRIHAEFLAKSAIYEINIPDDLSALVGSQIQQLKSYEPTPLDEQTGAPRMELTTTEEPQPPPFALSLLFTQTQLAILNLVETDSFRRFILTAEFHDLLAAANEAEAVRRETQADLQGDMTAALHEATQALHLHSSTLAATSPTKAPLNAQPSPPAAPIAASSSMMGPSSHTESLLVTSSSIRGKASPSQRKMPSPPIELLPGSVQLD